MPTSAPLGSPTASSAGSRNDKDRQASPQPGGAFYNGDVVLASSDFLGCHMQALQQVPQPAVI